MFKPGQSGNPQGRAKDKPWKDVLKLAVSDCVADKTKLRLIAEKTVEMALEGDIQAIQEIGNRLDGKPQQQIDANLNHGATEGFLEALKSINDSRNKPVAEGLGERPDPAPVRH